MHNKMTGTWVLVLATMLLAAMPAAANEHDDGQPTLVVLGRGEISLPADMAVVRFGAVAEAQEAAEAQEQVNRLMANAIDQIKDAGIQEHQISTSNLTLHPVYSKRTASRSAGPHPAPRIEGYRASYTLRVVVKDIDKVGQVLDAGLASGANKFEGVEFQLRDDTAGHLAALTAAGADARAKAQTIAKAMDVGLLQIVQIDENAAGFRPPQPMRGARVMLAETATPIQPDEITLQATLTVRYRIDP